MKKTLLSVASSVAFAAVVALVGCSGPTVNYDTIESIDAPDVSAETYAGVVRLTWDVVKGAQYYEIYKDGVLVADNYKDCVYMDVAGLTNNLVDGVKYTYDVVAVPKSNYAHAQERATYYVKENMDSVTVKAYVPSQEAFKEEYEDYFALFTDEDTEFKAVRYTDNRVWEDRIVMTAPTLPEFGYNVRVYVDVPAPFATVVDDEFKIKAFTFTENDAAEIYATNVLGAGDLKTSISIVPLSPIYPITVIESSDVHVSKLTTDSDKGTRSKNAWYVSDDSGTKVHLEWIPAQFKGVCYAPAGYSVYSRLDGGDYVKVEGEIKVLNPGAITKDASGKDVVVTETRYYIEETVNKKDDAQKKYFVTLYVDGDYESWWVTDNDAFGFQDNSSWVSDFSVSAFDDGKKVRVSFRPAADTDSASMYTVYRTNNNDETMAKIGEVQKGTYTANNGNVTETVYFYVDDSVDTTVDYSYVVYRTYEGEISPASFPESISGSADTAGGSVSVNNKMALDKDLIYNDVFITITVKDPTDSFTLSRAKDDKSVLLDSDFTPVTVASALWGSNTKKDDYKGEYYVLDKNLEDGNYVYKVVFTGTDKKCSEVFGYVKDVGVNPVEGPAYVDWADGKIVVEDKYRKNSETRTDYTYSYKILARSVTANGTDSDINQFRVSIVDFGTITPTDTDYKKLATTEEYSIPVWSESEGKLVDVIYHRNSVFGFNTAYNVIDADDVYVHGEVKSKYVTTATNLELFDAVLYVTKTNNKTGKTDEVTVTRHY